MHDRAPRGIDTSPARRSHPMNIFKSMAVKDLEEATRAIPVIDFGPAFRGDPGGLDAVAEQVRRASEQVVRGAA
jgi:hypothetical protein